MKNNTDTAKTFLYSKGEPEWYVESKDVANYLVAYHNHLMAEEEKEQPKELNTFSTVPFAFVQWYSGMKRQQIINAFKRWENGEGQFKD